MHLIDYRMKFLRRIFVSLMALSSVAACSDNADYLEDLFNSRKEENQDNLKVTDVRFSDDYKTFVVDTRLMESIGAVSLADPDAVTIEVNELDYMDRPAFQPSQPVLTDVVSTGAAQIVALDLKMLVLVDLTLSQDLVDKEREAVKEMSTLFTNNNLFVSFITHRRDVSGMMAPSAYVLENYFKSVQVAEKNLFSSISNGLDLLADKDGPFSDVPARILMVLSDGKLFYDDSFSVGTDYFKIKQELLDKSLRTEDSHMMLSVDMDEESDNDAGAFLETICRNTGGLTYMGFDWVKIEKDIFNKMKINYTDYRFEFANPDNKMYSGFGKTLKINCWQGDRKIASGSTEIKLGSFYKPVIVSAVPVPLVVVRGIVFGFAFLSLLLLVLLLLEPAVRYRLFRRKYVARFTDANMSVCGTIVGDSCYYCKAPFVPGDEIVAKCKHTMHKSCWDENEYHCPEFGRNCREGSHYYNEKDKFDTRNAPYYAKWLIVAVLGGIVIWLLYMFTYNNLSYTFLDNFAKRSGKSLEHCSFIIPAFGAMMMFVLTAFFSILTVRRRSLLSRAGEILLRALVSAAFGALFYHLGAIVDIALELGGDSYLIDWAPWMFSGFAAAFCSTWRTNFKIKPRTVLIVLVISEISMYLWSFLSFNFSMDYRPYLLIAFEVSAIGLAVAMVQTAPRSERYFLHASGAIKEMDIALYKWFASNPDAVVSIGKSVDCSLEMSWDIAPGIGPRQAEIRMRRGAPYLYAVDKGVKVKNRFLHVGEKVRLYHGRMFRIGNTEFVYQERDI